MPAEVNQDVDLQRAQAPRSLLVGETGDVEEAVEGQSQITMGSVAGHLRSEVDAEPSKVPPVMPFDEFDNLQTHRVLTQVRRQIGDAKAVMLPGWQRPHCDRFEPARPDTRASQLQVRLVEVGKHDDGNRDARAGADAVGQLLT